MKKRIYTLPQVEVIEMEIQQTLATSQIQATVNNPTDEVDAGNALSRGFDWDE